MKRIIWLASYPKSGNTWVRGFLTSLIKKVDNEEWINHLVAPLFASRRWIDEYLFLESSEFTFDELEAYTPFAIREFANTITEYPFFIKAHDAYTYTQNNEPLFPADVSKGAIYIVRNPLDVAVSFSHHNNDTIDNTIVKMANSSFGISTPANAVNMQLRQRLLTWSMHAESWMDQKDIEVLFLRYEDMVLHTFDTFKKIVEFSGLSFTDEDIRNALEKNSFDKLKALENRHGFREKAPSAASFFRKGKIGSWQETLTPIQVQQIITDHRDVMKKLGYLDSNDKPVY